MLLLVDYRFSHTENTFLKDYMNTYFLHEHVFYTLIPYFIENKMQLERMEKNAASAYRATHNSSYLEIIIEIKNVITNANRAYDITILPFHLPNFVSNM